MVGLVDCASIILRSVKLCWHEESALLIIIIVLYLLGYKLMCGV